ncbi:hypothetical protein GGR51DRAFT_576679 [Nemania sp. FL0031]|nr:hypothetical protein GGR51DRAFT_576679 [Nemania sp. FL0031]
MAKQRKSKVDKARVQDAINLIKSVPTIRRTRVKNPTRTLTPEQYAQVFKFIDSGNDMYELGKLRYDYTLSTKQFEIRMPTELHGVVISFFMESYLIWRTEIRKSNDAVISSAAETTRSYGSADIRLPSPTAVSGVRNMKSPDGGIQHRCELRCPRPTLVLEVGWSETREQLKEKAEHYILGSKGKIRTVVAVDLGEMYAAEQKNEARLRRLYRKGTLDMDSPYSYSEDENNKTGGASFLVWRAKIIDGTVTVGRVREQQRFRNTTGDAIQSASLSLSLKDCVCEGILESVANRGRGYPLEIQSEALCQLIDEDLIQYRKSRAEVVRDDIEAKREKNKHEGKNKAKQQDTVQGVRMHDNEGVLGRVSELGRLISTRIRGRRNQM